MSMNEIMIYTLKILKKNPISLLSSNKKISHQKKLRSMIKSNCIKEKHKNKTTWQTIFRTEFDELTIAGILIFCSNKKIRENVMLIIGTLTFSLVIYMNYGTSKFNK